MCVRKGRLCIAVFGLADNLVTDALAELLLLLNTAVWGSSKEAEQSVGALINPCHEFSV